MKKKVAVIGSGISGIVSAHMLQHKYDVLLIEAKERLGGHTYTVPVNDPVLGPLNIDMGFIVFNLLTYPLFTQFLKGLGVDYQDSDMSFGFYDKEKNFYYNSDFPFGTFAQKRQVISPRFWRFLYDISAFNKRVLRDLNQDNIGEQTVGQYLETLDSGILLKQAYILAMGAAIWSCPIKEVLGFPAKAFFLFWKNHQLLTLGTRPIWKTLVGGSQRYIDAFERKFQGEIKINDPVKRVKRNTKGVEIQGERGSKYQVDLAIIATHADQALKILDQPTTREKQLLSVWNYSTNTACLHSDPSVMPPRKVAWSSWEVQQIKNDADSLQMSYYMNRLQRINSDTPYFVTLNDPNNIRIEKIHHRVSFTHPIYSSDSLQSQTYLSELNQGKLHFCGSYFGNGFHEDGVRSAVDACLPLGGHL
ncbi:MAG: FAD-dependent oxidoreductase [bacterium]